MSGLQRFWRGNRFWQDNRLTILVVVALLLAFVLLRNNPTEVASVQEFLGSLQSGQPTVVTFYSNY